MKFNIHRKQQLLSAFLGQKGICSTWVRRNAPIQRWLAISALLWLVPYTPAQTMPPARAALETEMQYSTPENSRDWLRGARFGIYIDWTPRVNWDQNVESPYFREAIKTAQKTAITSEIKDSNGYPTGYHNWETFNPTNFNPDAWIDLFIESGAQFIVEETIDEYGWSSFDTPAGTYDSAATDWAGDICAELAEAAKGRIPIIWHQRQHGGIDFILAAWTKFKCRYAPHVKNYPQFRKESIYHLISHTNIYGKAAAVLLSGPHGGDGEHPSREGEFEDEFRQTNSTYLTGLLAYQPWLIMSGKFPLKDAPGFRPYINLEGTSLPNYRSKPRPDDKVTTVQFPQESDMPCWAFGYPENDRDGREFIKLLAMSICRDGNFMVRVAPRPDGSFEPHHIAALREIGAWLKNFGESIYGTRGGPYEPGTWGGSSRKHNSIYLHILQNTHDGKFYFPALPDSSRIASVTLLNNATAISWSNTNGVFAVNIPSDIASDRTVPDRIVKISYDTGYDTLSIGYTDIDNRRFRYTESFCCKKIHPEATARAWHNSSAVPFNSLYRNANAGDPEELLIASSGSNGDSKRYSFREKNIPFWMPPDWFECPSNSCPYTTVQLTVDLGLPRTVSETAICEKGRRIHNWSLEYMDETSSEWRQLYLGINDELGMFDYRFQHPVTARKFRITMQVETFATDGAPRAKAPQLRYFRLYNSPYYPDAGTNSTPYLLWTENSRLRTPQNTPEADPDNDGIPNAAAFCHGAPDAFSPPPQSAMPHIEHHPNSIKYCFLIRTNATEFVAALESSTNLLQNSWQAIHTSNTISVVTNPPEMQRVEYNLPRPENGCKFYRLRIHNNQ
jgi:alpha-L-fucosidase